MSVKLWLTKIEGTRYVIQASYQSLNQLIAFSVVTCLLHIAVMEFCGLELAFTN